MAKRRVKEGDTKRRRWQLRQQGDMIDLTLASGVLMLAQLAPGQEATGTTALNAACAIDSATEGIVKEPVGGTGDLVSALYRVEFQITFTSGEVETVPDEGYQELEVIPDLN